MKSVAAQFLLAIVAFIIGACGGGSGVEDASANGGADAGMPDSGVLSDTGSAADAGTTDAGDGLPDGLPFDFARSDEGDPLSPEEVTAFTKKVVGFLKSSDFFNWLVRVSHGMDPSTGYPDYLVWWQDVIPSKAGDTVTFTHHPCCGAHNTIDITVRFLAQAISGYMLAGDPVMAKVVEQYSKGVTATMKGYIWDANDPAPYLMARNIVNKDHAYTVDGGRKKAVVYSTWYNEKDDWNTKRIHFPNNPTWGDVWVHNMRSKDDVPHIFHVVPLLRYAAVRAPDQNVRAAAAEAAEWLRGFSRDIVDSGYYIRSKDKEGKAYIPTEDLASFVTYETLDPRAECNAKLNAALIGYGEPRGLNCMKGGINAYEETAIGIHYYNFDIVASWHVAAILNALVTWNKKIAEDLLEGLAGRVDKYMHDPDETMSREPGWKGDLSHYLLRAACAGLPLTSAEVRLIHGQYAAAAEAFSAWEYWDLWDASVPEGNLPYNPGNQGHWISIENYAYFLEYCWSPFRNDTGAKVVDCEIVRDTSKW
jgi:hypothetical protein